jgi:hypothetical protein
VTETVSDGFEVVEVGYAQPSGAAQQYVAAAVAAETARATAAEAAALAFATNAVAAAITGMSPAEFPAGAQGSGLTHSGTGQVIGGVTVTTGLRVLDTAAGVPSGLWVAASGAWARPADFAAGSNAQGKLVDVSGGGVWLCVSNSPVTVDTTSQVWTEIDASVIQAGTGLSKAGNVLSLALTKALVLATGLTYSDVAAAPLASPALTGTPTAPTATALTSTTQLSTTAFVTAAIAVETARARATEASIAAHGLLDEAGATLL